MDFIITKRNDPLNQKKNTKIKIKGSSQIKKRMLCQVCFGIWAIITLIV